MSGTELGAIGARKKNEIKCYLDQEKGHIIIITITVGVC